MSRWFYRWRLWLSFGLLLAFLMAIPASYAQDGDQPEAESVEDPPEAAYVLGLILRRYADERLTDSIVSRIAGDVYGDLARSAILSSFPLSNSDEPAFVFRACRDDD